MNLTSYQQAIAELLSSAEGKEDCLDDLFVGAIFQEKIELTKEEVLKKYKYFLDGGTGKILCTTKNVSLCCTVFSLPASPIKKLTDFVGLVDGASTRGIKLL